VDLLEVRGVLPGVGCQFLAGNECSIYEDRPAFCRVGYSREPGQSDVDYKEAIERACAQLQTLFPSEG